MTTVTVRIERAPPSLRGTLSLWLVEIAPCTYIGEISARVRDRLWTRIEGEIRNGRATMAWCSQGTLKLRQHNPKRPARTVDGITLTAKPVENAKNAPRMG